MQVHLRRLRTQFGSRRSRARGPEGGAATRVVDLFCESRDRDGMAEANAGLPLTQQQIASITGQTPINVNRIMRAFDQLLLP